MSFPFWDFASAQARHRLRVHVREVDIQAMSRTQRTGTGWFLTLVKFCTLPSALIHSRQAFVLANGGCVQDQDGMHPHSAAISFKASPKRVVGFHAFLLYSGVHLGTSSPCFVGSMHDTKVAV